MDRETREQFKSLDEKLSNHFSTIHEEMSNIKRGIYGDEKNKVKGLIDRQNEDDLRFDKIETRVKKVELRQWKSSGLIAGVMIGLQFTYNYLKDIFK